MSTRSQTKFVNSNVFLYQHFDGYNLPSEVQEALKKKARWNDEEYLTRIVFDTMIQSGHYDGCDDTPDDKIRNQTTGYGIGTSVHGDIEYLVEINVEKQTIEIKQGYNELKTIWTGSFEEFIEADVTEEALSKMQNS